MKTFLSSTYVDLASHRKAAAEAIERLGQQVGRMEVFGARPVEPSAACLAEIDECDLFVGIYAHRYGHIPNGSHVSITEAEFDYAKANHKPLFCFLVHEDQPWPPKMIEDELYRQPKGSRFQYSRGQTAGPAAAPDILLRDVARASARSIGFSRCPAGLTTLQASLKSAPPNEFKWPEQTNATD
jgi:hypothetical protein